jgi:arginine utilization regulatory protein
MINYHWVMDSIKNQRLFPDIEPGEISFFQILSQFHEGIMITDKVIERHHLSVPLQMNNQESSAAPIHATPTSRDSGQTRQFFLSSSGKGALKGKPLATIKTEHEIATIISALRDTKGNAARAARNLGISPQLMNYKLKRLNIDRKDFI